MPSTEERNERGQPTEKHRDVKAELNRRSQVCGVLTGTGISRRGNVGRDAFHRVRKFLGKFRDDVEIVPTRLMDGHEGGAPSTPVWKTGVCLSTPLTSGPVTVTIAG